SNVSQTVGGQDDGQVLRAHIDQFVRDPIERVYAAYVDPALMPKWMGIKAVTNVRGPLDRPGSTFVEVVYGPYTARSAVRGGEPPGPHGRGAAGALGAG